jgi:class 3 adenylate cyclase
MSTRHVDPLWIRTRRPEALSDQEPWPNDVYCANRDTFLAALKKRRAFLKVIPPDCRFPLALPKLGGHDWFSHEKHENVKRVHGAASLNTESTALNVLIPVEVCNEVEREISNEKSELRKLSTWPITRTFLYIDISDFSTYTADQQALVINSLNELVDEPYYWQFSPQDSWRLDLEARLCIGDGYIFVFVDTLKATYFAAYLAQLVEEMVSKRLVPVEFHFRMGMHVDPVYSFWDPGRDGWNYVGDGVTGGQRVLSAIGKETDDVLYLSGQIRSALLSRLPGHEIVTENLQNRGRRLDKHGQPWRVYEVNHTGIATDRVPPELRWYPGKIPRS